MTRYATRVECLMLVRRLVLGARLTRSGRCVIDGAAWFAVGSAGRA